ncbi:hypothetical protein HYH03_013181, partial [Edaphochlamys debaryana]
EDAAAAGASSGGAGGVDPSGRPHDPYAALLARLRLPPEPSWALPVDPRLVQPGESGESGESGGPESGIPESGESGGPECGEFVVPEPGSRGPESGGSGAEGEAAGAREAQGAQAAAEGARRGAGPPALLEDDGAVRLWHRLDVSFGVPKTHVFAHLITPAAYASPAAWVTARLAVRILDELLQPDVYDAQLVGTSYSLTACETGFVLAFHGFSGVVARLAEVVAGGLAGVTLRQVEDRYDLVHGKLLQSLRLWRHNNPAQHAEYYADHLLQSPHWHADDSVGVLEAAAAARAAGGGGTSGSGGAAGPAPADPGAADVDKAGSGGADFPAGPRAVWALLRGLGRGMALEVLVYGNSSAGQARDLCATLRRHLQPSGLGPGGWPATRVLRLEPLPAPGPLGAQAPASASASVQEAAEAAGAPAAQAHAGVAAPAPAADKPTSGGGGGPVMLRYVPSNPNPANTNSAMFFLCQAGEDLPSDPRPSVLLELLAAVASKPAFHALRTRQRLGYAVACGRHRLGGTGALSLRIQSPDRDPAALRQAVAAWLEGFAQELRDLPPERLSAFKASLLQRYREPPRSLAEAARRCWQPVRHRGYAFDRRERKARALEGLGLQDLVAFFEAHALPSAPSARLLCCELWGAAAGGDAAAAAPGGIAEATKRAPQESAEAGGESADGDAGSVAGAGAGGWVVVRDGDVGALHGAMPHYCHSETLGVMRPLGAAAAALTRGARCAGNLGGRHVAAAASNSPAGETEPQPAHKGTADLAAAIAKAQLDALLAREAEVVLLRQQLDEQRRLWAEQQALVGGRLDRIAQQHEAEAAAASARAQELEGLVRQLQREGAERESKMAELVIAVAGEDATAALVQAAREGRREAVLQLLALGVGKFKAHGHTAALHGAAAGGHAALVGELLAAGARIDGTTEDGGKAALYLAAENGHEQVVKLLLAAGANPEAASGAWFDEGLKNKDWTPLHVASWKGHAGVVQALLEAGADKERVHARGSTALYQAALKGHAGLLRQQLDEQRRLWAEQQALAGDRLDRISSRQEALAQQHEAQAAAASARAQELEGLVRQLQREGAERESKMAEGAAERESKMKEFMVALAGKHATAALVQAAREGRREAVLQLLAWGVDKDARDEMHGGQAALHGAAARGHAELVGELLAAGARMDGTTKDGGKTALYLAAENGYEQVVKLLLTAGANLEAASGVWTENGFKNKSWTPLHAAASKGHTGVIQPLLKAEADKEKANARGSTALYLAAVEGHVEAVELLLAAGANPEPRRPDGWTPLTAAATGGLSGHTCTVEALLRAGADVNKAGPDGQTALYLAAQHGHLGMLGALLAAGASVEQADETSFGWTPLMAASWNGHLEAVTALLAAGANKDASYQKSLTALDLARSRGHSEVVELLRA